MRGGKKRRFRLKIEGKKNCANWFIAMELPKIGGERERVRELSK